MNKEEIFNLVRSTTIDIVGLDENEVKLDSSFANDLGVDSLLLSELVMSIEDKFSIRITDIEAEKLKTIGDVVNFLHEKKNSI